MSDHDRHAGHFSEGQEKEAHTADKDRVGSFGDGQAAGEAGEAHPGHFSEGQERTAHTPDKDRVGTYDEGVGEA